MVSELNDHLAAESADRALRAALGARPFRWYPQIGSTNDAARAWIADHDSIAQGAVVISDEQTAGRGRFARPWHAPPGSALLFSVIIRHNPAQWARLPLLGALAVAETLEALTESPTLIRLKWPNDVQIGGRKVAGILAETDWRGERPFAAVLGIGLNVRINFDKTDLAERATSVEPALNIMVERFTLLASILQRVDYWAARLADPGLIDTWRSRLITIGSVVTARAGEGDSGVETLTGLAFGVDPDGALLIRDAHNQTHRLVAGEVTLRDSAQASQNSGSTA